MSLKDYSALIGFIRSLYPGKDSIALHEPVFSGNERDYVLDCIDSTYVSSVGKYTGRFEEMLRSYTGAAHTVAAVNGTAALHLSLQLAGVGRGDLVITQPLTFVATSNAIAYCGAEPAFVDIDPQTLGLSASVLEQWLSDNCEILEGEGGSSRTGEGQKGDSGKLEMAGTGFYCRHKTTKQRIAACVPMHTFGHPCEIDRIMDTCARYGIPVIEDAAEAIGSLYKGKHAGTYGTLGIISFNGNKTITAGGGGIILTNSEEIARLAKHLSTQAKVPHPWQFNHDRTGYNYRLPNINAALGCAQMERITEFLDFKRSLAQQYSRFCAESGFSFVSEPPNARSNYWLNAILLDDEKERDGFLQFSNGHKVMTRPCWTLMNKLPMNRGAMASDLSAARDIEARLVNLPSGVAS